MKSEQNEQQQTSHQSQNKLDLIKKFFDQIESKCLKGNQGKYICISQQCQNKNPLVCLNQQCQCYSIHQLCNQMTFKKFQNFLFNLDTQNLQLQDSINKIFDNLIDQISSKRDSVIERIKQGKAKSSLLRSKHIQIDQAQIKQKGFTGCLISKIQKSFRKSVKNQKLANIVMKIEQNVQDLKSNSFQKIIKKMQFQLFQEQQKIIVINKELSSSNNKINANTIKCESAQTTVDVTMLSPSINRINGNIIKWKVKIIKVANWIGIGICLRQFIKKENFKIKTGWNDQNIHGHYVLSNNKSVFCYKSKQENNKSFTVDFIAGDIVLIQLNKTLKTLRFLNQRSKLEKTIRIIHEVNPQEDEYHICVSFYQSGNEVEILSPVQTQINKYEIQSI